MFEDFLNHRCDIFHLVEETQSAGYGIRTGNVLRHEAEPSLTEVPCHFHVQSDFIRIEQNEPYPRLSGEEKLSLPYGTDIRQNDLVRDCQTGHCYRCDIPKNIREHHIVVKIRSEEGLKGAI